MVTIRDVARLAGVSPATVSQALNGRGRVDVRTRERVAQAATKLRYAPNLNGRRLARRRAECVAVLQGRNMTTAFNDSFYRVVLGGMAEVTQARGYSLVFTPPADPATDADLTASWVMARWTGRSSSAPSMPGCSWRSDTARFL